MASSLTCQRRWGSNCLARSGDESRCAGRCRVARRCTVLYRSEVSLMLLTWGSLVGWDRSDSRLHCEKSRVRPVWLCKLHPVLCSVPQVFLPSFLLTACMVSLSMHGVAFGCGTNFGAARSHITALRTWLQSKVENRWAAVHSSQPLGHEGVHSSTLGSFANACTRSTCTQQFAVSPGTSQP